MIGHPASRDAGFAASASRYVDLLDKAAARLLAPGDPARLVEDLFALIADELRLDAFFNYQMGDDGELHLLASGGISSAMVEAGARLNLGVAVCGCVARDRTPAYVPDVHLSQDPQHAFIKTAGLRVYACTPMIAGDRLLGTLGFGRRWSGRFEADELQFLRTVTHHLAVAHEHLRNEAALRDSRQRLSAVLDNASVAILASDEAGRCDYMNAAAEALIGRSAQTVRGSLLADLLGADEALRQALEGGRRQSGEGAILADRTVAFSVSPAAGSQAQGLGVVVELRDITAERRLEAARVLLMREVDHRARNALAVVQSLVQLTPSHDPAAFKEAVVGRVRAMARAQSSLARQRWEGAHLSEICREELDAVAGPERFTLRGPVVVVAPEQVQPLGMILHELATNAAKYGALARSGGRVILDWDRLGADRIAIEWREQGGDPVAAPSTTGFGSRLISQLSRQLRADVAFDWREDGLVVRLIAPLGTAAG